MSREPRLRATAALHGRGRGSGEHLNGASSRLRTNGREESFTTPNRDPGPMGMAGLMLGGRQELTDTAFAMTEIPELLVFNRALSDSEIDHVETYLRDRYFP